MYFIYKTYTHYSRNATEYQKHSEKIASALNTYIFLIIPDTITYNSYLNNIYVGLVI